MNREQESGKQWLKETSDHLRSREESIKKSISKRLPPEPTPNEITEIKALQTIREVLEKEAEDSDIIQNNEP